MSAIIRDAMRRAGMKVEDVKDVALSNGDVIKFSAGSDLVAKLEKFMGAKLKAGRNNIKGYPVDIEDQDPDEGGIGVDPVDRDAAKGLLAELQSGGFKVRRNGPLTLVIMS